MDASTFLADSLGNSPAPAPAMAASVEPLADAPDPDVQDVHEAQASPRPRPGGSRRRDKVQLSCDLCRRRKLRCDRQQPCSTCASRNHTCTYPENAVPAARIAPGMHQRLQQLERLVMSIAAQPSAAPHVPSASINTASTVAPLVHAPANSSTDHGIMHASDAQLHYIGSDHWVAIMDTIADLKDHFEQQEQIRLTESPGQDQGSVGTVGSSSGPAHQSTHSLLLYGHEKLLSHTELIAALPSRSTIDRYISRYFNRQEMISSVVHSPTFLRKYDAFWADPYAVPIAWLGLLFGICCLAALASDPSDTVCGDGIEQPALRVSSYRQMVAQCLLASEYTQGGPHVLEALLHHVYIEFSVRADADKDVWFLLALEVNLAMRMGCHRDPDNFPALTPLEREMRRRVWAVVLQCDVLISSQMGLPRMITDSQCDTAEPRNLNDSDLDDDTLELPPSRPETEVTTVLGTIARRRMMVALGLASDTVANVKSYDYTQVLHAESKLHEAAASIPPPYKMKSLTASLADSPQLIMSRLFLSHLLYKGQIALHRRFVMAPSSVDESVLPHSLKLCLDASLAMLNIQHILHEETRHGGRLDILRWRLSSVLKHQLLTATMMLCSLLYRGMTLERDDEIIAALRGSRGIWMQSDAVSEEARKAAHAIGFVLMKAKMSRESCMHTGPGRPDISTLKQSDANDQLCSGSQAMLQDSFTSYIERWNPHVAIGNKACCARSWLHVSMGNTHRRFAPCSKIGVGILPYTVSGSTEHIPKPPSTQLKYSASRTDIKADIPDQPSSQFAFDFDAWEPTTVSGEGWMFTSDGQMW